MTEFDSITDATRAAIEAATHLTTQDAGAIEAMLALARKIDAWDVIVGWALDDVAGMARAGQRPAVPQNDNVSISAYLKYCDQLGLTPAGRASLPAKKSGGAGGKLGELRSVHGGKSA